MIKDITYSFVVKIFNAIFNLGIAIFLSQVLGAEGKGFVGIFVASVALNVILIEFVGGSALTYFASRFNTWCLLKNTIIWNLFICSATFVFSIVCLETELCLAISIFVASFLNGSFSLCINLLSGIQQYAKVNKLLFIQTISLTIAILFIYFAFELKVVGFYASFMISNLICLILSYLALKDNLNSLLPQMSFTQQFKEGFKNQSAHLLQFISQRISFWLLAQKVGMSSTGILTNVMQITESTWMMSNSIAIVQYGKISNEGNTNLMMRFSYTISKLTTIISFVGLIIIGMLPPSFFSLLFGNEFSETGQLILWLVPGVSSFNILLVLGHYFSGLGKFIYNSFAILGGCITTALLTAFYWDHYTLKIAVIICSVSYIISSGLILIVFLFKNKLPLTSIFNFKQDYLTLKEISKIK